MQHAQFAVGITHFDFYLLVVRHKRHGLNAQPHRVGLLLFEALVVDDVQPGGKDLRRGGFPLEQDTAVKHRLPVLRAEKRADALLLQLAKQRGHRVGGHAVLSKPLFAEYPDFATYALVFEQGFQIHVAVCFLLRRLLLQFEHLILAYQYNGCLEAHVTHITGKSGLKLAVVAE